MSSANDQIAITETVGNYRKRKGVARLNDTGRVTLGSFRTCSAQQKGRGYILSVRGKKAKKDATVQAVEAYIKTCEDSDVIVEIYPTRFCTNTYCGKASWSFLHFPEKGHSTCRHCGYEQRLIQSNMDSRHLGEDEKVNKNLWNCTPGMDANDSCIRDRKGNRVQKGSQRIRSHMRNYWRMREDIEDIGSRWSQVMNAVDFITRAAQKKAKKYYYKIHNGNGSDDEQKMPHGRVQFAAACFYAAVLEFEQSRSVKTPCTLTAIQESASDCIIRKKNRQTRDVTVRVIIRYTKLLKSHGLCGAHIPEITADTLRFTSKQTGKEHTRLAIFNKCQPTNILLPADQPWGIDVGDTERGVLYIDNVCGNSSAFKAGVQKGDYIFQVEDDIIGVEYTKESFGKLVGKLKREKTGNPFIKVGIMREKK